MTRRAAPAVLTVGRVVGQEILHLPAPKAEVRIAYGNESLQLG